MIGELETAETARRQLPQLSTFATRNRTPLSCASVEDLANAAAKRRLVSLCFLVDQNCLRSVVRVTIQVDVLSPVSCRIQTWLLHLLRL